MATSLRLGLSLSSIRRVFGAADVAADHLLTQDLDFILAQDGRTILANQSQIATGAPEVVEDLITLLQTQERDQIILQSGEFLQAEQFIVLGLPRVLQTQSLEQIITQSGDHIIENLAETAITTEDDDFIIAQNGDVLIA